MGKGPTTTLKAWAVFLGVALVAAFSTTTPKPWALAAVGLGLGCFAGSVRVRAIAAGTTARMANALGWLCGVGLLVLAMAFAEDMFVGAWVASFAGYLFADRVCSLAFGPGKGTEPTGRA